MRNTQNYTSYEMVPWHHKNWFAITLALVFAPALLAVLLTGDVYYTKKSELKTYSKSAKVSLIIWSILVTLQFVSSVGKAFLSENTSSSEPVAAAQSQSSQSSPQKTSINSVDGYKSFKFGMKPSELIKLAECPSSQADTYEKTKEKINEIGTNIVKIDDMLKEVQLARNELDHSAPINSWEEQQKLEGIKEISARENKLKTEREDIVRSLHGAFSAGSYMSADEIMTMDKEAYYKIFLRCTVGFAGGERGVDFTFDDQKQLKSLGIIVGKFNQQKLDSLIEELRGKYPLSSSPSDVAIATYNGEKYSHVSWFFADNSVELKTIKAQLFDGVPVIVLSYHDAASAKEAFNTSQKGKVSSGDL